jgi:hypothetical protein
VVPVRAVRKRDPDGLRATRHRPRCRGLAFATIFGTVTSSAPRIAIEAIPGTDGRLVMPHCTEALPTDGWLSSSDEAEASPSSPHPTCECLESVDLGCRMNFCSPFNT